MDTQLRNWAVTGHYSEGEGPSLDRPHRLQRPAGRGLMPMVALLVPIGIACGALLAVACVVRLILLPFVRPKTR